MVYGEKKMANHTQQTYQQNAATSRWSGSLWPLVIFGATVLLNLIILATTSWVSNGYVSKSTFDTYVERKRLEEKQDAEKLNGELREMTRKLQEIIDAGNINSEQNRRISELEATVKEIERSRR